MTDTTDTTDTTDDTVVVDTPSGAVRGIRRPGSLAFLGIPYAEAPAGDLRYDAPVPRRPWTGVLDALAYGPTPQRVALAEVTAIPEPSIPGDDTLSVNVFTPDTTGSLPVLVWIHGGGYVAGSPASPWYDGAAFNRDGVVTVAIAYRLGFDGFGVLPDAPHNRGVLDQLLALAWVRDHIASFGGDPTMVTIGGQSAGGGAVMTLFGSPASRGLFRAVASFSGSPGDVPLAAAEESTRDLAARLGVEPTRAGFAGVSEADVVTAQGSGLEVPERLDADATIAMARDLAGTRPWAPVVDGVLVTAPVGDAIAAAPPLPLLLGATRDEFAGAFLAGDFGGAATEEVLSRVGASATSTEEPGVALGGWVTDMLFRRHVLAWAAANSGPSWVYDFVEPGAHGIAEHCIDVPFVFDVPVDEAFVRLAGPDPSRALAAAAHGALVRFVVDGDPGWAPFSTGELMRFAADSAVVRTGYETAAALLP